MIRNKYIYFFKLIFLLKFVSAQSFNDDRNKTTDNFKIQNFIVNRHDFTYIINPEYEICDHDQGKNVFLFVYVHSSPSNFKRRQSIRDTWSRRSMFRDIRIVFMMGNSLDKKENDLIKLENNFYGDIVQENFVDSYKNLTYKGIMAMKWISQYCRNAKYILKVDDDIITNMFIILRHLKSLEDHKLIKKKTVMCLVWVGMIVQRDVNSKWYLSKDTFKQDTFDKYCSGSAYVLTGDLAELMYNASWYLKFFWVDDYYMTGLLAAGVNATHEFFNSLYIINGNLVEPRFLGKQHDYTVFGHIPGDLNKMYKIWNYILKNQLYKFPSLYRTKTKLLVENDFTYLKEFKWDWNLWWSVLKQGQIEKTKFEYENY